MSTTAPPTNLRFADSADSPHKFEADQKFVIKDPSTPIRTPSRMFKLPTFGTKESRTSHDNRAACK